MGVALGLALAAFAALGSSSALAGTPSSVSAAATSTISGTVRDGSGNAVASVNVSAYAGGSGSTCCTWVVGTTTDASGAYSLAVAPGIYRLQFYPPSSGSFIAQWWNVTTSSSTFEGAGDVDVSTSSATGKDASLLTGFTQSGLVTDGSGAVSGVNVGAYAGGSGAVCCTWVASAVTGTNGRYALTLPAGTYRLQFYPPPSGGDLLQWWNDTASGATSFEGASDLTISSTPSDRNAVLSSGRRITGAVTNGSTGAGGVNVAVFSGGTATCCTYVAGAVTDASGNYTVSIAAGVYRLQFQPGPGLIGQWYSSATTASAFDAASDVDVTAGSASGINAALASGNILSGRVTSSGAAVSGANVSAFTGGSGSTCCTWVAGTQTDAAGNYLFTVPAGTYRVQFFPRGTTLIMQWYNATASGAANFGLASDVDLTTTSVAGVNAALATGTSISGQITAATGGAAIAGANVSAFVGGSTCCVWVAGTSSDASGNYTLLVPSGTYRLQVTPANGSSYLQRWYSNTGPVATYGTATDVDVTAGPATGKSVALPSGNSISGTVRTSGGAGIPKVRVSAYSGTTCCTFAASTLTTASGAYSLPVTAGSYRLQYSAPPNSPYITMWSGGGTRFDLATGVDASGGNVTGADATLAAGNAIAGTVTTTGGSPVQGAMVNAFAGGASDTCCTWVAGTRTDAVGAYGLTLPASVYRIQINAPSGSTLISQWYDGASGATDFAAAVPVDVSVSGASGKNATLSSGVTISGTVTSGGGSSAVANAWVGVFAGGSGAQCCTFVGGVITNASGQYTVPVPAGTYRLQFNPQPSSGIATAWWVSGSTAASFSAASDIDATAGSVSGKDIQLASGQTISGTITSSSVGVGGVNIAAFAGGSGSTCCTWVAGARTSGSGGYSLVVPSGKYRLQVFPPSTSSLVSQWYNGGAGATSFANASDVDVTGGAQTANVALASGNTISGTVSSGGAGVQNVFVGAFTGGGGSSCCTWIAGVPTNSLGHYTLALPTGTYRIQFMPQMGSNAVSQWYKATGSAASFDGASDIDASTNPAGVNATLQSGNVIAGTVTNASGQTLPGVNVAAFSGGSSATCCTWVAGTMTSPTGTFRLALPAGTYRLQFNAPPGSGYISQWFNGSSGTSMFDSASNIDVTSGNAGSKNVTLLAGNLITGTVTGPGPVPLPQVWVSAFTGGSSATCCTSAGGAVTDLNGNFAIAVAPGTYRLQFNPRPGVAVASAWWSAGGPVANFNAAGDIEAISGGATGKNMALVGGKTISGVVVLRGTTTPVPGVNVNAFDSSGCCTWIAGTRADPNGAYTLVVPSATYKLQAFAPPGSGVVGGWYLAPGGGTPPTNATSGATFSAGTGVDASTSPTGINFGLGQGKTISGRVVDPGGNGIQGVNVGAFLGGSATCCTWVAGSPTDPTGNFALTVANGTYRLQFSPPPGSPFMSRWLGTSSGVAFFNGAADVAVSGSNVPGQNIVLAVGNVIGGTVRSGGGAALVGVNVSAYTGGAGSSCCTFVSGAMTDSVGHYSLVVLPGLYRLQFTPAPGSSSIGQWWNGTVGGAMRFDLAGDIDASAGSVSAMNATLQAGTTVTGRVTAANGGANLASINVNAYDCSTGSCSFVSGARTATDGTYSLAVPNGTFVLQFSPPPGSAYLPKWYGGADSSTATPITVGGGAVSPAPPINAQLSSGSAITGQVTTDAGIPIPNVNISANNNCATGCTFVASTRTLSDGTYSVVVPNNGSYKLFASPAPGSTFVRRWFNATQSGSSPNSLSSAVNVNTVTVPGVNVQLPTGNAISGRVTALDGTPIFNASVNAYDCSGQCASVAGIGTDTSGNFTLVVPAGQYKLWVNAPFGSPYLSAWFDGTTSASTPGGVSAIDVSSGSASGKNVALGTGFAITGTVTAAAGGAAIPGANVSANICANNACTFVASTGTGPNGNYSLVVPSGTYQLQIRAPAGTLYLQQWFDGGSGASSSSGASNVTISGAGVAHLNAALALGIPLSGTVTVSGSGAPIAGLNVVAFVCSGGTCTSVNGTNTAGDGTYILPVPANGSYSVKFKQVVGSTNYIAQWWNNSAGSNGATAIAVTTAPVTGISAQMVSGLVLTGTVTAASGGASVPNVNVNVNTCSGGTCTFVAGSSTQGDGTYTVVVPNNTFKIQFQNGGYNTQWWNGGTSTLVQSSGTGVATLTMSGSNQTVNAALQ